MFHPGKKFKILRLNDERTVVILVLCMIIKLKLIFVNIYECHKSIYNI